MNMYFLCKTFFRSEFPGISLRIILLQADKRNSVKKNIYNVLMNYERNIRRSKGKLNNINKILCNKNSNEDLTSYIFRATILHSQRINRKLLHYTINLLASSS